MSSDVIRCPIWAEIVYLWIGDRAAIDVMPYQLDPALQALATS